MGRRIRTIVKAAGFFVGIALIIWWGQHRVDDRLFQAGALAAGLVGGLSGILVAIHARDAESRTNGALLCASGVGAGLCVFFAAHLHSFTFALCALLLCAFFDWRFSAHLAERIRRRNA